MSDDDEDAIAAPARTSEPGPMLNKEKKKRDAVAREDDGLRTGALQRRVATRTE